MIVVAIGAHPDDELYAAGTLARYASDGHTVFIVTTTRGEGGPLGDPPVSDRENLATVREAEGRAAARILGARDVRYLPFVDPLPGPNRGWRAIEQSLETFSGAIAAELAELRPDVLITHGSGGEYGHPQHLFTHQAVFTALAQLRPWRLSEVLTWEAAFAGADPERRVNPHDPADLVVDISPWLDKKVAAAEAHLTQYPAFLGNHPGKTVAEVMELQRTESFHRWTQDEKEHQHDDRTAP